MDRRPSPGRSRHLLSDRTAGSSGDRAAHPDHRAPRRPRARFRRPARRAVRRHQRGQAGYQARLRPARHKSDRIVDARLLAGPPDLMGFVAYFGTIPIYSDAPTGFWNALLMYSVPAAAVGFRSSALMMRLTRSSMLEVLRQDYIRTARSKGASEVT